MGQAISQGNAIVQTLPGYSVVTGALYGLRIAGAGAQLYFDNNASLLWGARAECRR